MSSSGTAQETKAKEGTSKKQSQVGDSAGSVLGISSGKFQDVEGKPKGVIKFNGKEIDTWNAVMTGAGVKELENVMTRLSTEPEYELISFIRAIEYQGFDRIFYVKHALTKMSVSVFARMAIIGGLRGSNFTKIAESCDNMPQDLVTAFQVCGFVKTPKRRTDFTILRCTASIPHWVAFWCMHAGVAKKIPTNGCPAELQFPGAASLPMSREVRMLHLRFSVEFSQLLPGGRFNPNIYLTAMRNAIPVSDIPEIVRTTLGVSSNSEAYSLTNEDIAPFSQQVAKTN
ncbi:nucleocapsid protein [Rice dwarf-associated bunya-like virus]|uniref:Nucleocapsid protein n=1 Tax=Rice dwarf-associated bunya-like virus TaxID=2963305 RepID=A0AAE9MSC8_9VIRU|nr:nucleocapsid protein [Rice dwarf-associated bunya-like virus]